MKKTVLHLLIILGTLICSPLKAQESSFDPNKLKSEYFNDKEVKDGLVFNDKKGNTFKIENSDYSKGLYVKKKEKWVKHGVWYNMSGGRVIKKQIYTYGKKNGVFEEYHKNGKVKKEYQFVNGIKQGMEYQYRDDGTKIYECPYQNDKMEGVKIEYRSNGSISSKKNYKNGEKHGESLHYNDKGKLVARSQYEFGKKVGKTQQYN